MSPTNGNDPLSKAKMVYEKVWDGGPYTSFDMIDYLIKKVKNGHGNMQDFLLRQTILESVSSEAMKGDSMHEGLEKLWNGRTGFCTSFAIKVVEILKEQMPGTFKFDYYDFGNHRIARCTKTKIVIDSSASCAFKLEDGEEVVIKERSWYYSKSESKFKNPHGKFTSSDAISDKTALICCLQQLAKNKNFLCFFRGHIGNGSQKAPGFDGMIKWQPGSKAVRLMWETPQGKREQSIMEFGKGDEASHKECIVEIFAFMKQGNRGIDRAGQFKCVEKWHWELWANAIALWGWPKIKK